MYEGWHVEFSDHAKRRMAERSVDEAEVFRTLADPETVSPDVPTGKLLTRYLEDWDRILVVAIEERPRAGVILVKTVLWSKAS